jgi:hypothetical protein
MAVMVGGGTVLGIGAGLGVGSLVASLNAAGILLSESRGFPRVPAPSYPRPARGAACHDGYRPRTTRTQAVLGPCHRRRRECRANSASGCDGGLPYGRHVDQRRPVAGLRLTDAGICQGSMARHNGRSGDENRRRLDTGWESLQSQLGLVAILYREHAGDTVDRVNL